FTTRALKGPRVADAPAINSGVMTDGDGNVRFAFAAGHDDLQKLRRMGACAACSPLNAGAAAGAGLQPLGFARGGAQAGVQSERPDGPDVIERIDVATGERTVVMSDPRMDPVFIVWSADGAQPIGAAYGFGVPRARFWDETDPDAKLLRMLEA